MIPFDAVFIAAAAGRLTGTARGWWLAGLAPVIGVALAHLTGGHFTAPITGLLVMTAAPRAAVPALVLAMARYVDVWDAIRAAMLWLLVSALLDGLDDRLDDDAMHWRVRGTPVRLVVCAVLYACLLPLSYV